MLQEGLPGVAEDSCELRPRVRGAHIHNPDRLYSRLRWLDTEEARGLAALDTAPKLAFRSDDQVLVQRVSMGDDFNPFAATSDHGEDRGSGRNHPHIMLQLRHVFLG